MPRAPKTGRQKVPMHWPFYGVRGAKHKHWRNNLIKKNSKAESCKILKILLSTNQFFPLSVWDFDDLSGLNTSASRWQSNRSFIWIQNHLSETENILNETKESQWNVTKPTESTIPCELGVTIEAKKTNRSRILKRIILFAMTVKSVPVDFTSQSYSFLNFCRY